MSDKDFVELGVVTRPHGIKGGAWLRLHNVEDSVLKKGSVITLRPLSSESRLKSDGEEFEIKSIAFGNKVIAYLEGIRDRTHLEELIPFSIHFPRSLLPPPREGEYYIQDFIGKDVYEEGKPNALGMISDFYDNGAQIVFVIKTTKGNLELPFVDQFFPVVDLENNKIVVIVPEYLGDKK